MKPFVFLLLTLFSMNLISHAQKFPYEKGEEILNMKAEIHRIGEGSYYLSPLDDDSKRYIPMNLPEELKIEELIVKVSGYKGKIPPMIKMIGTPFMMYSLKVIKKPKGLSTKLKKKYEFALPAQVD